MGRINARGLRKVVGRHAHFHCPVYIETGLHTGRRVLTCAPFFDEVHGIELDDHWYSVCAERTADMSHVTIHHGDTRDLLPRILDQYPRTSCFIHLDAHFCHTDPPIQKSEFPLWEELALIRARKVRDIVSVDDVHTFGKVRDDLKYSEDAVEWEGVTSSSILDFFGEQAYDSCVIQDGFIVWKTPEGEQLPPPPRTRWWSF